MDEPSKETEHRIAALRSKLADLRKAVEWLEDARCQPVLEYFAAILRDYERLLHEVNIDERVRDRACYVVDALTKHARIKDVFAYKLKALESELAKATAPAPTPESMWNRIMTFVR